MNTLSPNLLKELECPVCLTYLKTPIHVCSSGHSVCHTCRQSVTLCPVCRSEFKLYRNVALENIAKGLRYPCNNNLCNEILSLDLINEHQMVCPRGIHTCPMNTFPGNHVCHWRGFWKDYKQHYTTSHHDELIEDPYFSSRSITTNTLSIFAHNEIFLYYKVRRNQKWYFAMKVIGTKLKAAEYRTVMTLGKADDNEIIKKTQLVRNYNEDWETIFKEYNCLQLDDDQVRHFIHRDKLDLLVEIHIQHYKMNTLSPNLLKELECPVCLTYLKPPIRVCSSGHSVCHTCRQSVTVCPVCRAEFKLNRNVALENIAKGLRYPCNNLCNDIFTLDLINEHEMVCPRGIHTCPMNTFPGNPVCHWRGFWKDYKLHYTRNHHARPIEDPDFSSRSITTNILLIFAHNEIFLYYKVRRNEKWYFAMKVIGTKLKAEKYRTVMTLGKADDNEIIKKTQLVRNYNEDWETIFNEYNCLQLDDDQVSHFIHNDKLNLLVEIQMNSLPQDLLKELECPVCLMYLRPPIQICASGHSVCHTCRQRVAVCPTCRAKFTVSRNVALENIAKGLQYPCSNQCDELLTLDLINEHEMVCQKGVHSCPMNKFPGNTCLWRGCWKDYKQHYITQHRVTMIETADFLSFSIGTGALSIFALNEIFLYYKLHRNEKWYFAMKMIGTKAEAAKYRTVMTLTSEDSSEVIVKTQPVRSYDEEWETIFKNYNCLQLDDGQVRHFIHNDKLDLKVEIRLTDK
ncbi:hypothetical protein C0J52_26969 [Blattella germanica]|nr:hypothetical protein C0J52_26969 [Blattella germanica]